MAVRQGLPSPLLDLPIEILLMVVDILDTRDVSLLLRTARNYASILDPILYQRARSHVCTDGSSVLEWAATKNQAPVIRKLLNPQSGDTPIPLEAKTKALCLAAEAGWHSVIELLVDAGADLSSAIDLERDLTFSPLQLAAENGHEEAVHVLLGMGADITVINSFRQTALHCAARWGQESVTRLLLERGADVAAVTISRETALHYAVWSGNEAIVKLLLEKGADIQAATTAGHTALICAFHVEVFSESMIDLLLAKGANVSVHEASWHLTPLLLAAEKGSEWAVRSLLANGANVMDCDYLGHTTLPIAAETGNEAVVKMLLEKGADFSAIAVEEDDTPRNFAEWNGHEAIARLLDEATAQPAHV